MDTRELTYGEKAVGLTFNPSNDPMVQKVKELYAQIIDLCKDSIKDVEKKNEQGDIMMEAIRHAQTGQMWAVKGITWKMIVTDGSPMGATTSDNKQA